MVYSDYWEIQGIEVFTRREFITPQTKWAGGVEFGSTATFKEDLVDMGDTIVRTPYDWDYLDIWGGWQFLLGGQDSRKTLPLAIRGAQKEFSDRPYVEQDSNKFFHNGNLLLGGISLAN